MAQRGRSTTLVASSRPPSPTSSTVTSTRASAKRDERHRGHDLEERRARRRAAAVDRDLHALGELDRSRRSISAPSMRMRSVKRSRCGDVYSPDAPPAGAQRRRTIAAVEPLPLVPATCTTAQVALRIRRARRAARASRRARAHPEAPQRPPGAAASRRTSSCGRSTAGRRRLRLRPEQRHQPRRASPSGPARLTIESTMPCCSRNSERWKPSGSFCRIVCSMTRGPAKPMSALGSAMMTSPSIANDAATPPVVGCSSTLI